MEAFKKTVLVPIVLIVIVFAIEYVQSTRQGVVRTTPNPTNNTQLDAKPISQAQFDAYRQRALAAGQMSTSTRQLLEKQRREAQQKYASSTYNPVPPKQKL